MLAAFGQVPARACVPLTSQEDLTDKAWGCPPAVLPPQVNPVSCGDPLAVQLGPATHLEDGAEAVQTHLLIRADLGVHCRVPCSSICKEKKAEGQ